MPFGAAARRSRLVGSGIIAAASANAGIARGLDRDLDLPEGPVHGGVGGRVGDGVLVADVVSHLVGDLFDLTSVLGEEHLSAGRRSQRLECALGALGFAALLL